MGSAQPGSFHAGFECHSGSLIGTVMLCDAMVVVIERDASASASANAKHKARVRPARAWPWDRRLLRGS
jgi:hypothetical protein